MLVNASPERPAAPFAQAALGPVRFTGRSPGHIVTELNITPIPTDRPPFPVPDLGVPTYFTIQPA